MRIPDGFVQPKCPVARFVVSRIGKHIADATNLAASIKRDDRRDGHGARVHRRDGFVERERRGEHVVRAAPIALGHIEPVAHEQVESIRQRLDRQQHRIIFATIFATGDNRQFLSRGSQQDVAQYLLSACGYRRRPIRRARPNPLKVELVGRANQALSQLRLRLKIEEDAAVTLDIPDLKHNAACIAALQEAGETAIGAAASQRLPHGQIKGCRASFVEGEQADRCRLGHRQFGKARSLS